MTGALEGRSAVIAGVGPTIGSACALRFAREGAQVLAVDPDEEAASRVAAAIAQAGGWARPEVADITSEEGAAQVARRCEELWQRLDALVSCAAEMDWWTADDDTIDNWEQVIRTNLLGPMIYTKRLRPLLSRAGPAGGSVVYLSSIDGIRGNPTLPAYSVSKGGLIPLTHVMAHNCAPDRIRVNCIATAAIIQTPPGSRHDRASSSGRSPTATAVRAAILEVTPLGRRAEPDDIASAALFFASSESGYVTGTVLPVDGGRIAITPGTGGRST